MSSVKSSQHTARFRAGTSLPASTGRVSSRRTAVVSTDQTNSGSLYIVCPGTRILKIVTIKLEAPSSEEIPERCRLKIARSTEPPEWLCSPDSGG